MLLAKHFILSEYIFEATFEWRKMFFFQSDCNFYLKELVD